MRNFIASIIAAGIFLSLTSCSCDYIEPQIDSVLINSTTQPVEEVFSAYPEQTLTITGCGFKTLKRLIVNSCDIDLNNVTGYESGSLITFQLPYDISTTGDYIRVVTDYGMCDYSFIVRPGSKQPVIHSFTPDFIPGSISKIYGANLEGAYMITVPLTNGDSITLDCIYNPADGENNLPESVSFFLPEDVNASKGQYVIHMKKHDSVRGTDYIEKTYSTII